MAAQQFSLRWNNYSQHIVNALDDLRSEDELTDVTLSSEGQKIRAHQLLLSACSTFFRETFRENPCKHPVIILKGVSFVDLQAVVTFMYNGQVNVTQERLSSFLQTAEMLQIKGLTDMNDKDDSSLASNSNNPTKKRIINAASADNRNNTPETVQRPTEPKRRKVIPSFQQNSHISNDSPSNPGPSSSVLGNSGSGLIQQQSQDSNSGEDFPAPTVKYEEEEGLEEEEHDEYPNHLSEEGDNSIQDLGNVDQGAIEEGLGVFNMLQMGYPEADTGIDIKEEINDFEGDEDQQPSEIVSLSSLTSKGRTRKSYNSLSISPIPIMPATSLSLQGQSLLLGHLEPGSGQISGTNSPIRLPGTGKYKCDICGKSYAQQGSLTEHQRFHKGDYVCPFCGRQLSKQSHLNRHMKNIHGVQRETIVPVSTSGDSI